MNYSILVYTDVVNALPVSVNFNVKETRDEVFSRFAARVGSDTHFVTGDSESAISFNCRRIVYIHKA